MTSLYLLHVMCVWRCEASSARESGYCTTGSMESLETYEVPSCIRGHHVYRDIWSPTIGEELMCKRETTNDKDRYAVAVMRESTVMGHVPRVISAVCALFLKRKGIIRFIVSGNRRFSEDLPQGGLEVPCVLKFEGTSNYVSKLRRIVLPISTAPQPPNKKQKIDCDESEVSGNADNSPSDPWMTFNGIVLTEVDKADILNGKWLTDKHIDFAQALLKK